MKTDTWTVHLYRKDAQTLREALTPQDGWAVPHMQKDTGYNGQPCLVDEWGGFMFISPERKKFADNTWGYHGIDLKNEDEYCALLEEQVHVMLETPYVAGYCYTQLTDVEQEQNGVYYYDRAAKVSEGKLAKIFSLTPDWAE